MNGFDHMNSIKPKALVIGGCGGLGAEVCRTLGRKGFDIAFTYHTSHKKADNLASDLNDQNFTAAAFHMDLADLDQVKQTIRLARRTLGTLDALVISSGLATGRNAAEQIPEYLTITVRDFDHLMNINVRGVFFAIQEAARIMAGAGAGRIVIVGSIDGVKPVPAPVDYACSKGALWGMTQALSKELGDSNILVNMVAPGILEGGVATLLSEDLMEEYLKHSSLRRTGKFSEVAHVIAFLAGPLNTYVTGQAVVLDGGL
jgi:NAD(P)-dependent dehydrogenase (short-subunit alcohol dehydrogenase family)